MDRVDQLLTDIIQMKKEFQERKICTAEDMVEFASWVGTKDGEGVYKVVVAHEHLKNWLNERSRKEQYKQYLREAMKDNDVCLYGFDDWFEKFWAKVPVPA